VNGLDAVASVKIGGGYFLFKVGFTTIDNLEIEAVLKNKSRAACLFSTRI